MTYKELYERLAEIIPGGNRLAQALELFTVRNAITIEHGEGATEEDQQLKEKLLSLKEELEGYSGSNVDLEKLILMLPSENYSMDPRVSKTVTQLALMLNDLLDKGFTNFEGIQIIVPAEKYNHTQLALFKYMRDNLTDLSATDEQLFDIFYTGKTSDEVNTALKALGADIEIENYTQPWQIQLLQ